MKLKVDKGRRAALEFREWLDNEDGPTSVINVYEWASGEGFDIVVEAKGEKQHFSLSQAQLSALLLTMSALSLPT